MVISLLCSARNDGMTCGVLFAAEFTSCGNKEHSLKAVPLDWLIAKSRRIDIMPINDVLVRTYILYIFFYHGQDSKTGVAVSRMQVFHVLYNLDG